MRNGKERKGLGNGRKKNRGRRMKGDLTELLPLYKIYKLSKSPIWWLKTDSGASFLDLEPGSVILSLCDCVPQLPHF